MEFPKALTVVGNIALLVWVILDSYGFWLISPGAGVLFFIVALIVIYGVLKFVGCLRPCYHCKKCTRGFGRMAALYFGKRSLKDPKETYGVPAAIFFYAFLGPFPAAVLFVFTVQAFDVLKIVVLACLLALSAYSALTWHPTRKP
jgi:hypothetical protein